VETTETGDELRTERVSFAKGASSASVKGSVKGYDTVDYVVNAGKGQTMSVSLKSSSSFAYFNIRPSKNGFATDMDGDPKPMEVSNWKGTLPKSGDYYIRVYLVRAEARRKGRADFTLNVAVTGGRDEQAAVSEKPVFYSCDDRMEVVTTSKAGGSKITLEVGDTVLTLSKVPSTSGAKFTDAGEKTVFWNNGNLALFDFRGKSYNCSVR
jgi:membrane-bound inhibitor of C-type lysozyme